MPSDQSYTDQDPGALRLTLIEGALDIGQFEVYASSEIVVNNIRLETRIIGASHVVTFSCGGFVLHEIFACSEMPGVSSWSLDELTTTPVERQLDGACYKFTARQVHWTDPEPQELLGLIQTAARQRESETGIGIQQDFPKGALRVTPKTVVVGKVDSQGSVVIESAHSYPNVEGLVLSRSVLYRT